jgi:hypothetical protein
MKDIGDVSSEGQTDTTVAIDVNIFTWIVHKLLLCHFKTLRSLIKLFTGIVSNLQLLRSFNVSQAMQYRHLF